MKAIVIAVAVLIAAASSAVAQVKYVDERGVTHWVQNEAQVPEKYRAGATTPIGVRAPRTSLGCSQEDIQQLESDAKTSQAIIDSKHAIAEIDRRHRGQVESSADLEARMAKTRENATAGLKKRIECAEEAARSRSVP